MSEHFIEVMIGAAVAVMSASATIVTSLRGFTSVKHHVDVALQGKIGVTEYSAKVADLHGQINTLTTALALQVDSTKRLEAELARLRKAAK